jgi:predicted transcriptional regulator
VVIVVRDMLNLGMKRATITLPDDLEKRLNAFIATQPAPPSLNAVVQTALEAFLEEQKWAAYSIQPAQQPFRITAADEVSRTEDTSNDVSSQPNAYIAEAIYAQKITPQLDQIEITEDTLEKAK